MRWNRQALQGTGSVFRFSLMQQLKSKVNLISFLILFVMSLASMPIMLATSGSHKETVSAIETVYVQNDTGYALDYSSLQQDPQMDRIQFQDADFSLDQYEAHLGELDVFAELTRSDAGFEIGTYTLEETGLSEEDIDRLNAALTQIFSDARITAAGANQEQMKILSTPVQTNTMTAQEFLDPETNGWEAQFALQYAYAIIILIICLFSSSYIVRAIAEEKSSKLVEMLMVSVRPLALLVGKILAMMVYILLMIAVILLGFAGSYVLTGLFLDRSVWESGILGMVGIDAGTMQLGVTGMLVVIISLLLAYLTFSMMAGLSGCCCASIDDVEGANMSVVLTVMVGYLGSCIVSAFAGDQMVSIVSSLVPILSVFCAPVQFVLGNIGIGVLLLSWLLQLLIIVFLAVFSARVYNDLIVYRGGKVKLKQLLGMAKKGGRQNG